MHPASDRELDLASIPAILHDAGFRPSDLRVKALGRVDREEGPCFRIRGWSECFPLRGAQIEDAGEIRIDAGVDTAGSRPTFVIPSTPGAR
jgi:hypothetical protein